MKIQQVDEDSSIFARLGLGPEVSFCRRIIHVQRVLNSEAIDFIRFPWKTLKLHSLSTL